MYYGLRCYNKDGEPLGWLYTFSNDTEYAWTDKNLDWCKRWKTERGAKKNFERYNSRWQFKSNGGYLKIEVMPDIEEPESAQSRRQRLLDEWDEHVSANNGSNSQILSLHPNPEILQWLEEERLINDLGEPESDDALLNRKLEKLRKLEQQGFLRESQSKCLEVKII